MKLAEPRETSKSGFQAPSLREYRESPMKICSVVGTRPNFIKEYLVNQELRCRGIREGLIHTGQHHDYEMSQAFVECFELPARDYHLHIANTNCAELSAQAILHLATV